MNGKKVKAFVQEHKVEIIAGAGIVFGVITCAIVGKSIRLSKNAFCPTVRNKIRNIVVPDGFSIGKVTDLFEDGEEVVAIAKELTVNDLGKLGEELIKHEIATNGAEAAVMVEFLKDA